MIQWGTVTALAASSFDCPRSIRTDGQKGYHHVSTSEHYTPEYFKGMQDGSLKSARGLLPTVLALVHPQSLVDLGCGVGTWLAAARELGIEDVLGIDGEYVAESMLLIPSANFRSHDLTQSLTLDRTFDLAISLEVAEHLPASSAATLVHSLTRLAQVVLFSAAIPLQGGEDHINEQWQSYWADLFKARGYVAIDAIRPRIWMDDQIVPVYRQNTFLYCTEEYLAQHPVLVADRDRSFPSMTNLVHPGLYLSTNPKGQEYNDLQAWTRELEAARQWDNEQRQNLVQQVEQLRGWTRELEAANQWNGEQRQSLVHEIDDLRGWVRELEAANQWNGEQRQSLVHEIDDLRGWVRELEAANRWNDEQRQTWERIANEQQALQAHSAATTPLARIRQWFGRVNRPR